MFAEPPESSNGVAAADQQSPRSPGELAGQGANAQVRDQVRTQLRHPRIDVGALAFEILQVAAKAAQPVLFWFDRRGGWLGDSLDLLQPLVESRHALGQAVVKRHGLFQ